MPTGQPQPGPSFIQKLYGSILGSPTEVGTLLEIAKQHEMVVIPFIQTHGHFEVGSQHTRSCSNRSLDMLSMCWSMTSGALCVKSPSPHWRCVHWKKVCSQSLSDLLIHNPLSDSLVLLCLMMDQILALHPNAKWLHIGADEVCSLSLSPSRTVPSLHSLNLS